MLISLRPDKKPRPLRVRCLPVALLLLPVATNGDSGTSRLNGSCRTKVRSHNISRIGAGVRNLCIKEIVRLLYQVAR
jgi:hypothetical protein